MEGGRTMPDPVILRLLEQDERQRHAYKGVVRQAIEMLKTAAKHAPTCQEKCDLTKAILDLEEAIVERKPD